MSHCWDSVPVLILHFASAYQKFGVSVKHDWLVIKQDVRRFKVLKEFMIIKHHLQDSITSQQRRNPAWNVYKFTSDLTEISITALKKDYIFTWRSSPFCNITSSRKCNRLRAAAMEVERRVWSSMSLQEKEIVWFEHIQQDRQWTTRSGGSDFDASWLAVWWYKRCSQMLYLTLHHYSDCEHLVSNDTSNPDGLRH